MLTLHILLFVLGSVLLWISSRIVISGIDHIARRLQTSSFSISFLVLGILTSITEISVGINAAIAKKPEIFVGNLVGGSLVILLLVLPLLAFFNGGLRLGTHLRPRRLVYFLLITIAPLLTLIDGKVSLYEAFILMLAYAVFMYSVETEERSVEVRHHHEKPKGKYSLTTSIFLIVIGSAIIFGSSKLIINEVLYFADVLRVAPFLISILVLSIGTNLPELSIAVNAIRMKETDIAVGDYIGSAAANTLLFGVFSAFTGAYALSMPGYWLTFIIVIAGYALFFLFLRSSRTLAVREAVVLFALFVVFVAFHATEIISLSVRENGTPMTREEVILLLRDRYLELNAYESQSLPPTSIKTQQTDDGWYAAFITSGSGIQSILDAKCYFVSTGKQVAEIGHYVRSPQEFVADIDPVTCVPAELTFFE
jgi:cation:H+ antiporter